jgi:alpha-mannosidase
LIEVGGITATLLGGQSNPAVWRHHIEPTQKIYSWALNNHWETNYRAYQDGIITFRYALRPHGDFQSAEAHRFATGLTQPLVVTMAMGQEHASPKLMLSSPDVVVEALKPSEDGKAWIVTLFNATPRQARTSLQWEGLAGGMYYSNTAELSLSPVNGPVVLAPRDVVTVRVER